jgi:hypothetical protein
MLRCRRPIRTSLTGLVLAALGCGALGAGCDGEEAGRAEQVRGHRKALLVAEDRQRKRAERREATRVQDASGAMIASEERVAGIVLPRGLKLRLGAARQWYYETSVPIEAVRAYFGPRLKTVAVIQSAGDAVTYQEAEPSDTPGAERVSVRIAPLPNRRGITEITIRLPPLARPPNSEAEARLLIEERNKFAQ